jgi:cobalamin biosynthetic protein CobC
MLEHGGRLGEAARRWGIPQNEWLDLSTGIAPWSYPVPPLPEEVWQRLPEEEDGLEEAARAYYGAQHLLPLAGSQAAIQTLPRLFAPGRVALPVPLYGEHAAAWRAAGHTLVDWQDEADYAVLCNPNNPTGQAFSAECLRARLPGLRLMLVDEAFIDATPGDSLAGRAGGAGHENLIVLRSLGKFFGLAGARVGFALGAPALLDRLARALGPWAVAHPSRRAAQRALADMGWQSRQRTRLAAASMRLAALLREAGLGEPRSTALFQYLETPQTAAWHEALARRGILVRRFEAPAALRFGLPGNDAQWARLAAALEEIRHAAPAA